MLKIARAYLDGCGFHDGFFEELMLKALDPSQHPEHHIVHAPNGVGKTTILALLFSIFEPDRRKFLRTEINRQHKLEHYFLPNRLGVVALELEKEASGERRVHHVVGQVFWPTPASKGDEGEPGQRRFFAFQCSSTLSLQTLPLRGLACGESLRSLDDFTRWAREMRLEHPDSFFSTESLTSWRKYLTAELALDLRVIEVQRRFCAAEGGIGAEFLDFRNEQQFLEKIFGFMVAPNTAETVVKALATGLLKIRDLPRRRDQLKELTRLVEAFELFVSSAGALEVAEAGYLHDLKRLGGVHARARIEAVGLQALLATVTTELQETTQNSENAVRRGRTLEAEILFLEKTAVERRVADAKVAFEGARIARDSAERRARAAKAALVARRLASAEHRSVELEKDLERIEHDLAPDRMRLERAGSALHGHLERLAVEAERDANESQKAAEAAHGEAESHDRVAVAASDRGHELDVEIRNLKGRIDEHARERDRLEKSTALRSNELPGAAVVRLYGELAAREDAGAALDLKDESLQLEIVQVEGVRHTTVAKLDVAKKEKARLAELIRVGDALESRIQDNEWLSIVLAGETRDPYRVDLEGRVRAAHTGCEEVHRKLTAERNSLAAELAFLDAQGVSAVPEDVAEVTRALREAGFPDAQPAEHYLATFQPDADKALALVCHDPARFTGVFVAAPDPAAFNAIATGRRLRLRGPVVVSQATLEVSPSPLLASNIPTPEFVFRPFSASRFSREAAARERRELANALTEKESEIEISRRKLDSLRSLIEDLRQLHERYARRRPSELRQDREALNHQMIELEGQSASAADRARSIDSERRQIKAARREVAAAVDDLKRWGHEIEQFGVRYSSIDRDIARLPFAIDELGQRQSEASNARSAASAVRRTEDQSKQRAAVLRTQAAGFRNTKHHYPNTDGSVVESTDTMEYLTEQYRTAELSLVSRRDARQAHISQRLDDVRKDILTLRDEYQSASADLIKTDFEPFTDVVDLERAIVEAEEVLGQRREAFSRADHGVKLVEAKAEPVFRMILEAKVTPSVLSEFANVSADICDAARDARQAQRSIVEREIQMLESAESRLNARREEVKWSLDGINQVIARINDHLPETHRTELPDLSIALADIQVSVGQLIQKIMTERAKLAKLREECDELFSAVRSVFLADAFRQLEPQVADHLRSYVMRTAHAERVLLQTRLEERITVVQAEIENQKRDQNACLEQLRQHVIHADDLLRRAVRNSRIPEHVRIFGGQRILKIKRTLRDLSPDIFLHELSIWLDEQAISGRVPQDGAVLAAELLSRVHGGRSLDIEILKPKRDAIRPYMRVDRMGLSGGEGVTLAMMLYAVIQHMAMDERASGKISPSGGFLMLDNPYGTSNMLDHVVLQMAMADALGIQLLVTTCSEDMHVLNMYPTITRLVQGEVVSENGVRQYVRVRAADYRLKPPDAA